MLLGQRAKKVVSDSQGLVDFAIGLVNSVINFPDGLVKSFAEFKLQKNCEINLPIKTFLGLVDMMFGLVNVSFSLPEWQAVKGTFFAPCRGCVYFGPFLDGPFLDIMAPSLRHTTTVGVSKPHVRRQHQKAS